MVFLGFGLLVNSLISYTRTEVLEDYKIHKLADEEKDRNILQHLETLEKQVKELREELNNTQALLTHVAIKQGIDPDVLLNNRRK